MTVHMLWLLAGGGWREKCYLLCLQHYCNMQHTESVSPLECRTHLPRLLKSPSPFPSPARALLLHLWHKSRVLCMDVMEWICIMLSRGEGEERGRFQSRLGECLVPHPGSPPARPSSPPDWPDFVQNRWWAWIMMPCPSHQQQASSFSCTSCHLPLRYIWSHGGFCKHKPSWAAACRSRWMGGKSTIQALLKPWQRGQRDREAWI